MENVNKVADLNIIPKLVVEVDVPKKVKILELPKLVKFADGNSYFCMNVLFNEVIHQLNCQAKSLRFHMAVLGKKIGGIDKLIDLEVVISKSVADAKNYKNVEMYNIALPVKID